jgi:phage FluMu protein Com
MDPFVLIGLLAVVVIAAIIVVRVLRSRKPLEDPHYHFRCPHCRRKLGYKMKQAGHHGKCPRCTRPLVFPKVPEEMASRRD